MDPQIITPEQWDLIGRAALPNLVLFVGMMVTGTFSFLLAHAIIPSLAYSTDLPPTLHTYRRVLYLVSAAAIALMLYALGRGIYLTAVVVRDIYPRFAV